ncbi:MAG: hypothetical protein ABI605_05710 [Rhizobacter sp.]
MFGRSKPVVLEPYGRRRARGRPPRWLVLLLSGVVIGAVGVVVVQERYLPPRLSPSESMKLRNAFEEADTARLRLQGELAGTTQKLGATLADKKALSDELASTRATTDHLREDLGAVVASLPPDPRGGGVQVRSGQFTTKGGVLTYDVVLTREHVSSKPMTGVMQLVVAGLPARGPETTLALKPVSFSISSHEILRGSQALPEGFRPRETTIQVLDRAAGKALGMRVMLVKPAPQ